MLKVLIANNLELYFPHYLNLQMYWMIGLGYLLLYLKKKKWIGLFFFLTVTFQIFS
jgi:hypothetical protein